MAGPTDDPDGDLQFWRNLAEERGKVIQALHEFNYWHQSTVARGEVIAGLEKSVELWRERCLAAESNVIEVKAPETYRALARRAGARLWRDAGRLGRGAAGRRASSAPDVTVRDPDTDR